MKKLTFKHIIFIISMAIILFLVGFLCVLSLMNRKPIAAFYGIPDNTQEGIVNVLQTTYSRKNKNSLPYEIITLDNKLSLKDALKKSKKPTILFINQGLNAQYACSVAAKKKTTFNSSILQGMTSSVRSVTPIKNSNVLGVPLLIDHYEIDVNIDSFKKSNVKSINFMQDIEHFADKTKKSVSTPIIFAGKDDDVFINIIGALIESISGAEKWKSLVTKLRTSIETDGFSYSKFSEIVAKANEKDGELYDVINLIKSWKEKNILPKQVEQFSTKDVIAYLNSNLSVVAFMTLSQHRTVDYKTISKYSSIYFPSESTSRNFTAPIILGVQMKKNKIARNSLIELATNLQSSLSSRTGLAPTQASCSTPDRQADDVRYWVAASDEPLPTFCDAAFTTYDERSTFANLLRHLIK